MRRSGFILTWLMIAGFIMVSGTVAHLQAMEKVIAIPIVYPEDLLSMLDRPDVVILDVRSTASWEPATTKIRGAIREDPGIDINTWIGRYPKYKTYVLY
jgi:hypothetical protein